MNISMSLDQVYRASGSKNNIKVRFNDWTQQIKYFTIQGESSDGKRFVGTLDNGERMSYPKKSKGWSRYHAEAEYSAKAV